MCAKVEQESTDSTSQDKRRKVGYRVILDAIDTDRETIDSFCIKLSIFISTPVSRLKFITKKLPAVIWKFESKRKALRLLGLVREAGGIAHMDEVYIVEEAGEDESLDRSTCPSCGFPIDEGDDFCQFCMTPLKERDRGKTHKVSAPVKREYKIPPNRLLFYVILVLIALILKIAL